MILSIFNQKGGVAKTTTTINLGAELSKLGKVLLVDADPQANTTTGVGIDDEELDSTIYTLLSQAATQKITKEKVLGVIQDTEFENLYVLPSNIILAEAEITLANAMRREEILARILETVREEFEYILIDCPPSLGLLSINSLVASDKLIIPVSPSFFSIKGVKHLLNTVNLVQEHLRPELDILGILITKFDTRLKMSKTIRRELQNVFGDKLFDTVIRMNSSSIEYSQDSQKPLIFADKKKNNAKEDYKEFSKEVVAWTIREA